MSHSRWSTCGRGFDPTLVTFRLVLRTLAYWLDRLAALSCWFLASACVSIRSRTPTTPGALTFGSRHKQRRLRLWSQRARAAARHHGRRGWSRHPKHCSRHASSRTGETKLFPIGVNGAVCACPSKRQGADNTGRMHLSFIIIYSVSHASLVEYVLCTLHWFVAICYRVHKIPVRTTTQLCMKQYQRKHKMR